jgi:hypothetical protein
MKSLNAVINSIFYCRKWQDGQAGGANVVTFDGEDVRGVMYIEDDALRKHVIETQNKELMKALKEFETYNDN